MKNILNFLIETGKLKGKERRGWVMHGIKNSETTAEHIFYLTILAWVIGKTKKLNIERVLKLALVHDLCEVYSPDFTPYDPLLPKDKKKAAEVLKKWPKFTNALRIKKDKKKNELEEKAMKKLISNLPIELRSEIKNIWLDFSKGLSKEARFVRQADKAVNFLQGIEYWKKHGKIQHKLWNRWIKEIIDDPALIDLIKAIEKKFY
jgi:putative hydrolase of HD superfamily